MIRAHLSFSLTLTGILMFKDKTKSNPMATINEANLLKDLILFIQTLQSECTPHSTSYSYLNKIIQQLSQPIYHISDNIEGRQQLNEYTGLVLTELMLQNPSLFSNKTRQYIQQFERTINYIKPPVPARGR